MYYNKDYYAILNVSKDASLEEIKNNYRNLIKENHPDNNPKADIKFIALINEAYDVLSDTEKRKQYDLTYQETLDNNIDGEKLQQQFESNMRKKAKRKVLQEAVDYEIKMLEFVLEKKNQFIYDAILDKYSQEEYYIKIKEILNELEKINRRLIDLKERLQEEYYFSELERIDGVKLFVLETIKELDLNLEDLKINHERIVLENQYYQLLQEIYNGIDSAIQEICEFSEQIYLGYISKAEYEKIYAILSLSLNDELKKFKVLDSINSKYKINNNRLLIKLRSIYHVSDIILDLKLEELYNFGESIHEFKKDKENYDNWINEKSKKIEKIVRIMDMYPKNKKCRILYEYGLNLYEEQLNYHNKGQLHNSKFSKLSDNVSFLSREPMMDLERKINTMYLDFISKYEPVDTIKFRELPEDKKKFGCSLRNDKQSLLFRNMKNYGNFISRYKICKNIMYGSRGVIILYILNMLRELPFCISKPFNEHDLHLILELLLSFLIVGPSIAISYNINNWIDYMKTKIDEDPILEKLYYSKKK
jgi:curved DNA-binding protein CbpA